MMLSENDAQRARALVERARTRLAEALGGGEPLASATLGLEALVQAASECADLAALAPTDIDGIDGLLRRTASLLDKIVDPDGFSGNIYFTLGAVAGLLAKPDEFHTERLLHGAVLILELKVLVLRLELKERGDPLVRAVAIRGAWESPTQHSAALN